MLPSASVLLGKAKDCNVLLSITLHQIDKQVPQRRILYIPQFMLQMFQLQRVFLLLSEKLIGEIDNRLSVGSLVEVNVRDRRFFTGEQRVVLERIGEIHKHSMMTYLVFDQQVDQIAQRLRWTGLRCRPVFLQKPTLPFYVGRQVGIEVTFPCRWPRARSVRHVGHDFLPLCSRSAEHTSELQSL